jgi:hypothetical protein
MVVVGLDGGTILRPRASALGASTWVLHQLDRLSYRD